MLLRRLADMLRNRPAEAQDERSIKANQTEALRAEVAATLDRVDRIVPPRHHRLGSYARARVPR